MKKFFAICLSLLCFNPDLAHGATTPCSQAGGRASCLYHGGCQYDIYDGCRDCTRDTYNPSQSDCNDNDPTATDCHNECLACTNATGGWMSGAQQVSNSIFDINNQDTGLEYCAWVCQNGWFDDVAHNECFGCPTPTSGFMSYPASAGISHISTCNSCGSGQYIIKKTAIENGEQGYKYYCGTCGLNVTPTETGNDTNVYTCTCPATTNHNQNLFSTNYTECVCPEGARWRQNKCVCDDPNKSVILDSTTNTYVCRSCTSPYATNDGNGTCTCNAGYYGNPVGLNTVCHACPTNSTSVVNGVANAAGATSIDQCKCEQNYPIRSTNATTGAVTCSTCPSNATSYTTGTDFEYECKCDANYYGNGYISCDKCPAGTTKSVGGSSGSNGRQAPTTQADCKFSNNTKFCIPSTTRTVDNSGYVCFTPTNVTYTY